MSQTYLYRNKKNGYLYRVYDSVVDATNSTEGRIMILYGPLDSDKPLFVRDRDEFREKFEKVDQ